MSRSNWPYSSSITKVNDKETTPNFFTKYVSFRQNIYYNSQIWLTIKIRHSVSYIIRDLLGHRINSLSKHNLDNKLFWTFWTVKFFGTYIARVNFDNSKREMGDGKASLLLELLSTPVLTSPVSDIYLYSMIRIYYYYENIKFIYIYIYIH